VAERKKALKIKQEALAKQKDDKLRRIEALLLAAE
jgi:hypothetical protein